QPDDLALTHVERDIVQRDDPAEAARDVLHFQQRHSAYLTTMETHDVVIVGGGAMGASTTWHLRDLGVTDVVLVERDSLAAGSTSRSAGGFRAQFSDELNIRIALRSIAEFEQMELIDFRRH